MEGSESTPPSPAGPAEAAQAARKVGFSEEAQAVVAAAKPKALIKSRSSAKDLKRSKMLVAADYKWDREKTDALNVSQPARLPAVGWSVSARASRHSSAGPGADRDRAHHDQGALQEAG